MAQLTSTLGGDYVMKATTIWFVPILFAISARGQGTFQNLDFEAAQLIPAPGGPSGAVRFDAAFPGWTGYIGNQQATTTIPNGLPISFTYDPFIVLNTDSMRTIFQGHYMVTISGGYGYNPSPTPSWTPASIAQTGTIPGDAKSIRLLTNQPDVPGAGIGLVFLDGLAVPLYHLGSRANGEVWGGDISSFAGQTRELRLFGGWTEFDDITFSSSAIPEPSSAGLVLVGMAGLNYSILYAEYRPTRRSTEWRPRDAGWQFGSHRGAAIGELNR